MEDSGSFYKYHISKENIDDSVFIDIKIDSFHRLFEGHFPGQPVLPGVMILKMIVDCTSVHLGRKLNLKKATQCKFLNFVDPRLNPDLVLQLNIYEDQDGVDVKAVLKHDTLTFTKASLKLQTVA
jgi:3-hydroxyacyl-[acyl-carrier-protein] dehydratase